MHLTDNNMRKATCMLNECCNRLLHSCNMRGFGTFNKHVTCMLQACYVHVMCVLFLKNANKKICGSVVDVN